MIYSRSRLRISECNQLIKFLADNAYLTPADSKAFQIHAASLVPRTFSSRRAILHLDIHNENLLVSDGGIKLIDWECASIGPGELDLVHPYLNLFGEGFSGRRFEGKDKLDPEAKPLNRGAR